ncbi:reverse transcriptase N-terminal domain-containing protein [Crocosphaera sp. Alani8]|uniref:reverse transcriptase N-terminal domain-containing protein n=1 Tax=Crocosphaera sp. Alani8 TaxID=3038952 RepID=UPI00313AD932
MNTANASLNTQKAWNTIDAKENRNINWTKVQRKVFKLQKRIFQAVQSGQKAKARKLQQLLLKSHSAKLFALRQVIQNNRRKQTLVHPQKVIFNKDRAMQTLVKLALEPYWEARWSRESYGCQPAKSIHDAIESLFQGVAKSPKYILRGKIVNCLDEINHTYLLSKLDFPKTLKTTIKQWLKKGIISDDLSPLLVNIALDGMSKDAMDSFLNQFNQGETTEEREKPMVIRYVDDFLVLHQSKEVVLQFQQSITQWLENRGFPLLPGATRICHTLYELDIDGKHEKPGFDFLGFNVRQYPTGKHKSFKHSCLNYRTLIKPSSQSIQAHYQAIVKVVNQYKHAPQRELIGQLNPIIEQWSHHYSRVSSSQVFSKLDSMIMSKLRAWIKTRTGATGKKQASLYFRDGINGSRTFQTKEGHYLITHRKVGQKQYRDFASLEDCTHDKGLITESRVQ